MNLDEADAPFTTTVSTIMAAHETVTSTADFRDTIELIRSDRWKREVAAVQAAYATGGKDAAAGPKKRLPGILFSGTFTRRASSALIQHSGLICVDLDDIGGQLEAYKEQVCADEHTLAVFISPTGTGLKVVLRCDPTKPHLESFKAAELHMLERFGLEIDQACKDVARICFVSHDPDAFLADDSTPIPYPAKPVEFMPSGLHRAPIGDLHPGDDYDRRNLLFDLLLKHGWTNVGKNGWVRPGKTKGLSATFDIVPGRFYVFSSNADGFEANHTYKPWHVYTILEHHGDFSAAARELGRNGFGTPAKSRQQANLDRIAGDAPVPLPAAETDDLEGRRITLALAPKEPTTRLFLAGKPIATPGNLVSLISKAKTGKTATIGGVVAAIIAAHHDRHDLDTLKFTAPHTREAVILIDTEQSPFDAFTCHQRMFARANQQGDVDWLMHYSLVGYSPKQLTDSLPKLLAKGKAAHGGVFSVILDGVADYVNSVNDEAECNNMVTWLRSLAVAYDCPIICVIHSNEGLKTGDDGRGHLGKQLTRKAESNLLLKKTGDVTVITSEKQRKAPITEADGVAFKWSDEVGRHVLCATGPDNGTKMGRKPKYNAAKMLACLPGPNDRPKGIQACHRDVVAMPCGISPRHFNDCMADWIERGEVVKVGEGGFRRAF